MDRLSAALYFVVGILGVGYPVLLQAISRLDDKYLSTTILRVFNKERIKPLFTWSLYASFATLVLWSLKLPILLDIAPIHDFLTNSAEILACLTGLALVIFFFYLVSKVLKYYSPITLISYLRKKHQHRKKKDDYVYFEAITDIFTYAVEKENQDMALAILDFVYTSFKEIRDSTPPRKPVVYPFPLYNAIYRIIEKLMEHDTDRLRFLANHTAGGIWLIGEFSSTIISDQTYAALWTNLRLCIKKKNDDFVMYYWTTADQHLSISIDMDEEARNNQYDEDDPDKLLYKQYIENRNQFLEFHYALGGLLLYEGRFTCLKRIFGFTRSLPPNFPLLPVMMDQVFCWYFHFLGYDRKMPAFINHKFPFPRMEGQLANYIIEGQILEYIGILFLRQYSLTQQYMYLDPMAFPATPKTVADMKYWIDYLPMFKEVVSKLLENRQLLDSLNLGFITKEWCDENKKPTPVAFLDTFLQRLKENVHSTEIFQEVSEDKKKKFYASTQRILEPLFNGVQKMSGTGIIPTDSNIWVIRGFSDMMSKSAFADDQGETYVDADAVLANGIARNFRFQLYQAFFSIKTQSYLLERDQFAKGMRRLKLSSAEVVLILFNLDEKTLKIDNAYKDFDWEPFHKEFYDTGPDIQDKTIFIIQRADLPVIEFHDVDNDKIEKYELELLLPAFKLYAGLADLNKNPSAIPESLQANANQDYLKQVLLSIDFDLEMNFKKQIACVQVRVSSLYGRPGIPNKPDEIHPFGGKPKTGGEGENAPPQN
jgi:hypothetical protein